MSPKKLGRDYRADLFRGIALLTIFANHFSISAPNTGWAIFKLTPSNLTYFDGADVFVLISGFVFGLVYYKHYVSKGFGSCYRKAVERAWDLYVANVATVVLTFALSAPFYISGPRTGWLFKEVNDFFQAPEVHLPAVATMMPSLLYFDILPLYFFLLLVIPLFLGLAHRFPLSLLLLSLVAYVLAIEGIATARVGTGVFNVFQWQFHFVFGLLLGWYRPSVPRHPLLTAGALFVLVFGALDFYLVPRLVNVGLVAPDALVTTPLPLEAYGKGGPVAILQLLVALYLVAAHVPRGGRLYRKWFLRPIVVAGQHALPVFCTGIVLTYVLVLFAYTVPLSQIATLGLVVAGLLLSVGMGYLARWRRRGLDPNGWIARLRRRAPRPEAARTRSHPPSGSSAVALHSEQS